MKILLDVEGTTTPVSFVTDLLFPFARARVEEYLAGHAGTKEGRALLAALREEHAREREEGGDVPPAWRRTSEAAERSSAVAYVHWLMDWDRKCTALKTLQGRIWEAGYRSGDLRAPLFDDVPPAFRRWRRQGRTVAIFSSGSVLAQKLLFSHTTQGDLTPFIDAYFDTTTGPKRESDSYRRIAACLGAPPADIFFISDRAAELDAARRAGLETALCVRPPAADPTASPHRVIHDLDGLFS
ncbi:MAG: acireductone synthase [Acidobacteriota bacterium]